MLAMDITKTEGALGPENRRHKKRFQVADKEMWFLTIDDKRYPLEWVHDLSCTGMQIRQGFYNGFSEGQKVNLSLEFMGKALIETTAQVRWRYNDSHRINMNVLGLQFDDPKGKIRKYWKKKDVEKYLVDIDQINEAETERKATANFQVPVLSYAHVTGLLLMSFVAGLFFH